MPFCYWAGMDYGVWSLVPVQNLMCIFFWIINSVLWQRFSKPNRLSWITFLIFHFQSESVWSNSGKHVNILCPYRQEKIWNELQLAYVSCLVGCQGYLYIHGLLIFLGGQMKIFLTFTVWYFEQFLFSLLFSMKSRVFWRPNLET